jgi:glycosyltransferase involved in cell wall biosynthesis
VPRFSLIVPVYNSQAFIERCIDSIKRQNVDLFELIIVNDGSTDASLFYLESSLRDCQFQYKIINRCNEGVSAARNVGIDLSKGDYLVFLDSDDWLEKGYFDALDRILRDDIDGVCLGHYIDFGSYKKKVTPKFKMVGQLDSDVAFDGFLLGDIDNCPWNKVFRRELYFEHNIKFPLGLTVAEDAVVTAHCLVHAKSVLISHEAYVHYMQDTLGVTKTEFTLKKVRDVFAATEIIQSFCSQQKKKYFSLYVFMQLSPYFLMMGNRGKIANEEFGFFLRSHENLKLRDLPGLKWKVIYISVALWNSSFLFGGISFFYRLVRRGR